MALYVSHFDASNSVPLGGQLVLSLMGERFLAERGYLRVETRLIGCSTTEADSPFSPLRAAPEQRGPDPMRRHQ